MINTIIKRENDVIVYRIADDIDSLELFNANNNKSSPQFSKNLETNLKKGAQSNTFLYFTNFTKY
jgi:hypothetical protein